jgi:hypothetical protein
MIPIDQHHCLAANGFRPANGADTLAGLGLDVDRFGIQSQKQGQLPANLLLERAELRFLGEDDDINIDNLPTRPVQPLQRFPQEKPGVTISVGWIAVGISVADVAQTGSAKQGIGDGVQDNIGVTVTSQSARMFDADAAEDQGTTFCQPMSVVADADAHVALLRANGLLRWIVARNRGR